MEVGWSDSGNTERIKAFLAFLCLKSLVTSDSKILGEVVCLVAPRVSGVWGNMPSLCCLEQPVMESSGVIYIRTMFYGTLVAMSYVTMSYGTTGLSD